MGERKDDELILRSLVEELGEKIDKPLFVDFGFQSVWELVRENAYHHQGELKFF